MRLPEAPELLATFIRTRFSDEVSFCHIRLNVCRSVADRLAVSAAVCPLEPDILDMPDRFALWLPVPIRCDPLLDEVPPRVLFPLPVPLVPVPLVVWASADELTMITAAATLQRFRIMLPPHRVCRSGP